MNRISIQGLLKTPLCHSVQSFRARCTSTVHRALKCQVILTSTCTISIWDVTAKGSAMLPDSKTLPMSSRQKVHSNYLNLLIRMHCHTYIQLYPLLCTQHRKGTTFARWCRLFTVSADSPLSPPYDLHLLQPPAMHYSWYTLCGSTSRVKKYINKYKHWLWNMFSPSLPPLPYTEK